MQLHWWCSMLRLLVCFLKAASCSGSSLHVRKPCSATVSRAASAHFGEVIWSPELSRSCWCCLLSLCLCSLSRSVSLCLVLFLFACFSAASSLHGRPNAAPRRPANQTPRLDHSKLWRLHGGRPVYAPPTTTTTSITTTTTTTTFRIRARPVRVGL